MFRGKKKQPVDRVSLRINKKEGATDEVQLQWVKNKFSALALNSTEFLFSLNLEKCESRYMYKRIFHLVRMNYYFFEDSGQACSEHRWQAQGQRLPESNCDWKLSEGHSEGGGAGL